MKKFYQTIKERKLQIFFLMYILLLVPSMSLIAQNIPAKTLISGFLVSFGLLSVVFILSSFMTTKGIRIFHSIGDYHHTKYDFAQLPTDCKCVAFGWDDYFTFRDEYG